MIEIILPWPPSVNTYYRAVPIRKGRKWIATNKISEDGRKYCKKVHRIVKESGLKMITGAIAIKRILYCPDWRERDEDNTTKALYDSIAKAGLIERDSLVCAGLVEKRKDADNVGYVVLQIKQIDAGVKVTKSGAWLV